MLVCTDLGAPGCLDLHALVLPLYRKCLLHVPVGLFCVCVCVILCHNVILISVYIISYDMHDVSRYVHRCRVARVVLGCFGKVI